MSHVQIHGIDDTGALQQILTKTNGELKLDVIESGINQVKDNTEFVNNRLSNIQDWVGTEGGDGTGDKLGVMVKSMDTRLDLCDSSLNTIESNSTLQASRLSNIQDWVGTEGGDGTGDKLGVMVKSMDTRLDLCDSSLNTIESNSTLQASRLNNIQTHINPVPIGSVANLMSAQSCVAAGTFSSGVVDWGTTAPPRRVMIQVLAATSVAAPNGWEIYVSHDNTSWSVLYSTSTIKNFGLSTTNSGGTGVNTQGSVIIDWAGFRYMKIKVFCLATFTCTAIGTL